MTLSSTAAETAIAQCTSRWAMARGHRLNTSIVLAAVHGLSGLFRAVDDDVGLHVLGCRVDILGTNCKKTLKSKDEWGGGGGESLWLQYV